MNEIRVNNSCSFVLIALLLFPGTMAAQQIDIPRVEEMPREPVRYEMRDWREAARAYDAFVFDFDRTGEHLPLGWFVDETVNYPEHRSFGLATVVGTPPGRERFAEAINVLPALVGATLVGIDKSDQRGVDWVAMAREFFNRRPGENVYLNTPTSTSGSDWWYETMPNVFFYQLYDLYPETPPFAGQFTTVADRWLEAVRALGGGTAPWTVPDMNHRAIALSTMTPLSTGVPEPEAAGAIGWLLYQAHVATGEPRYRVGAEQAMDFLDGLNQNPAYELQLAYGVYAAARMNAELGTTYDVEQMMNWTFDVGPLRSWGVVAETWGDYGAHGLVGEVSANSYAFLMNGFQRAAALLPVARYDARFARALGRWALHLASNSRLFYPRYLPPEHQDGDTWAFRYDTASVIGHEGLRERRFGRSPYATGDAIDGGWGYTNLALYGSSHVGYLAALVDTTEVPMLLALDLRATDWFADGYPTTLFYNPHGEVRTATVAVAEGARDLYDAAGHAFVARGVTGAAAVEIPADGARVLVDVPAGGEVSYRGRHLLVDGVVVDFRARPEAPRPPRIRSLAAERDTVFAGSGVAVYCTAAHPAGRPLTYAWEAEGGTVDGEGAVATWHVPVAPGAYVLACRVRDDRGAEAADTVRVVVTDNRAPVIDGLAAAPAVLDPGARATLTCTADDPDGEALVYRWEAEAGTLDGEGPAVTWTAPEAPGYYTVTCSVRDVRGAEAVARTGVVVGHLVGRWPLDGTADDRSCFANDGALLGAQPAPGADGLPGHALAFDGDDDHVRVANHPSLAFREAMTVALWLRPDRLPDREAFLVSHGSWQHRWKLSITPDDLVRWTLRTDRGVVDLDDPVPVETDVWTAVAATYDGERLRLYRDGRLAASTAWSGPLQTTTFDLTLGQMLPGDTQYNFAGRLDEVRLYNRALDDAEVAALYAQGTDAEQAAAAPDGVHLYAAYPNPSRGPVTLSFALPVPAEAELTVFDVLGRRVRVLHRGRTPAGRHAVRWDGRDAAGGPVAPGLYLVRLRTADGMQHAPLVTVGDR